MTKNVLSTAQHLDADNVFKVLKQNNVTVYNTSLTKTVQLNLF